MPTHSGWLGGGGVVGCHFILKKGETDIYINFGMGGGPKIRAQVRVKFYGELGID